MEKASTTVPAVTHQPFQEKLVDYIIVHSGAILSAIVIVIIGFIVARWMGRLAGRWLERKALEPPVRALLARITRLLVVALAMVIALGTVGINVTALIAGLSVAGVGVGLAMQGVLGNLVAGLTIIFTKPFRVNEYIALLGFEGQVTKIELFCTTLLHPDLSRVVIPNRKIVGEILHNYGTVRQLDLSVGVAYGANLEEAVSAIHEVLKANMRVLTEPEPVIRVTTLGDSSINIAVRPWTSVENFGAAGAEIYQAIINRFRERKIEIPFPQREVRVLNNAEISRPALVPGLG